MDINKMDINKNDTAVVVTGPQNDVLSTTGVAWGLVGESIRENNTVEHIERRRRRMATTCSFPRTTTISPTRDGGPAAPLRR